MYFTSFEINCLLQSIGLSMLHSIWQTALLCLLYFSAIHPKKKYTASLKYNVAILLLFIATIWFTFSVIHHYYLFASKQYDAFGNLNIYLINFIQQYIIYTPYLAIIYLTAICIHVFKIVYQSQSKSIHSISPTIAIKLFTKQSALLLGIKKNVQIWFTANIDVPQVKGIVQPIILLPITIASNLNSKQIEAIIIHELAHVKRNDYALYILQLISNAILIFNPFASILQKAINKQREYSCDDMVLQFKYNKNEYATALYILEKNRHETIALSLAATNNKNGLLQRIKRIVEPTNNLPNKKAIWPYFLLLTCCCICLLMYKPLVCNKYPLAYYLINKNINFKNTDIEKAIIKQVINTTVSTQEKTKKSYNTLQHITTVALKKVNRALPQMVLLNSKWLAKKQKTMATYASTAADDGDDEGEVSMQNLVKIEEEQSGSNNKILYYFEVNNIGGKPVITPIYLATKPTKNIKQKKKTQVEEIAY